MTNKMYDALKKFALVYAPILVFCSTLLGIWDVPYQAQITATLAALDTCIGAIVAIAKSNYKEVE